MTRVFTYLGRFLIIVVGYAVASLAASAFLNVMFMASAGFAADEASAMFMGPLIFSIPFFALFVAYFAFIPSAGAILVAEIFGARDWIYYAIAGGIVAVMVLGFFWYSANEMYQVSGALDLPSRPEGTRSAISDPRLALQVVGAGMCGGIVFWAIAGQLAGSWRDAARPDPTSPGR